MLRQILLKSLGEQKYLSLLAASFQAIYPLGTLGIGYQDVYFLKSVVAAGDYCIDIGAHLGYYTFELSRLAGDNGKVYAVEPMSKFNTVISGLMQRKKTANIILYKLALGGAGEFVEMGVPSVNNMKKFGHARVITGSHLQFAETEKVKNEKGDDVFKDLPRLDFIKCDVEGLEVPVFSSMMETLARHRPVILCELGDKNDRLQMYGMLGPLGYEVYFLDKKQLHRVGVNTDRHPVSHNHYFIPASRTGKFRHLMVE